MSVDVTVDVAGVVVAAVVVVVVAVAVVTTLGVVGGNVDFLVSMLGCTYAASLECQ